MLDSSDLLMASPLLSNSRIKGNYSREHESGEEARDVTVEATKQKGIQEVKLQLKREKKKNGANSEFYIRPTKEFLNFAKTTLCDQMIVSSIFYVSSTLALTLDLDDEKRAEQEEIQADSLRILSSLYCQLLISPVSSNLPLRSERIFYETLIYFLDACIKYVINSAPDEKINKIIADVFRGGIKDPNAMRESHFEPIEDIVKKHWLSQRVPGKNRARIKHSTLSGTTKLIEPMVETPKKYDAVKKRRTMEESDDEKDVFPEVTIKIPMKEWDENGFPVDTKVPFRASVIPSSMIVNLPPPDQTSTSAAREQTPSEKTRGKSTKP